MACVPLPARRGVAEFVAATVRPDVRALSAYAVAKAEGMIKLDAMENPWPLPPAVRAHIAAVAADVPLNRYPDGGGTRQNPRSSCTG